ncbi:MAG TPA: hydantoinase/oxoprolinase family protein [Alphaproteobacteria bacterium]|nr:hydantoinase/oxoprolinase family protein [Alphaproteobacteria bacterium]
MSIYIGVDIGGTFTDLVLADDSSGLLHNVKTLTTPANPVEGVMTAVRQALEEVGRKPGDVRRLVHATTLPTNLVLERQGARVAYLTTKGFGDIFLLSKQRPVGPDRFNIFYERSPPFVPRDLVVEIDERMDYRGQVLKPLDEAAAMAALDAVAHKDPQAVAICLLHSYANPDHERALARLVRDRFPGMHVALSAEVWPEYLEYERATTTVLSAYIGPMLATYLRALEAALKEFGITCPLQIMQSSGGVMSAAAAARKAAYLIESGPAAGVVASAHLGRVGEFPNLISFDMGGTTAKAGVIRDGVPSITHDFRVGGKTSSGSRDAGEPIKVPVVDLAEVGAGGGSIARVDAGGFLQVGPRSAGASPGPACYGFGGTDPTVTDANVVLGYLDAGYFLGGRMQIYPELSHAAIARELGQKLGMDTVAAAKGIYDLANTHMASAIRVVTLQRGIDPRDYALTAFGGAGPLHAVRVAELFDIPTVVVPPSPGVKSAFGLLVSDLAYDYVATTIMPAGAADCAVLNAALARLEDTGRAELAAAGQGDAAITIERSIDLRFANQALDIAIPVPNAPMTLEIIRQAEASFRELYFETCGMRPADPCQIVNCRVRAVGLVGKPRLPEVANGDGNAGRACKTGRRAYFAESGGFTETKVYDRLKLQAGDRIAGPAIFEEPDSTTVCPPGYAARVDGHLNLIVTREAAK